MTKYFGRIRVKITLRPEFFLLVDLQGKNSDLGWGDGKKKL